jgi:hypothetical protein
LPTNSLDDWVDRKEIWKDGDEVAQVADHFDDGAFCGCLGFNTATVNPRTFGKNQSQVCGQQNLL